MKKNTTLYLIVGLVVLLAIVILVFGIFFLNDKDPRETFHTYYLRFDQVSTLAQDDPVKVNGVKLGKVESIALQGRKVGVRIRLRTDVQVPHNSEFKVQNIGLMGERQIGIQLGDAADFYLPNDTIDGKCDAGIAEAMGLAGEVFDSAKVILQITRGILDSTVATQDFRDRFRRILAKTETLEDREGTMLDETDPQLKKSLASLNDATVKVNAMLDENRQPVRDLVTNANGLTRDANQLVRSADTITQRLMVLTDKLNSKDNTLGVLLNDRKLHDDLNTTVQSADSLFRTILKDGLDVNIDLF